GVERLVLRGGAVGEQEDAGLGLAERAGSRGGGGPLMAEQVGEGQAGGGEASEVEEVAPRQSVAEGARDPLQPDHRRVPRRARVSGTPRASSGLPCPCDCGK